MIEEQMLRKDIDGEYRGWLREQYPVVLTSLGWLQIRLAKCKDAIRSFRKSLEYKKLVETIKGLAFCHHKEKNFNSSFEYFNQYFEKQPQDDSMRLLFADVLESRGDFNKATETLAQLEKKQPENSDIKSRLKSMRAKSKESQSQGVLTTNHFMFRYRYGAHDDLVQHFAIELERSLDQYIELYGFQPPRRVIEITFYPKDNFSMLVDHSPYWAQGLFDGRIRIPVTADRDQIARTLRHELVHALLYETVDGRTLPTWFNEGLAQRLECSNCGKTRFPVVMGGFLNETTLSAPFIGFSAAKAKIAYIQSLYLILNLESQMQVDDAFYRIISNLGKYSRLDSDSILAPIGVSFSDLLQKSEENWSDKKRFTW
jgi:tetratricopeptide (TPR) repeat protein